MRSSTNADFSRQSVKGIFFLKTQADLADCRKLVQELGCKVLGEKGQSLMIQTSRARLQELKARHLADEDDKAQITSRLQLYFERILIGGQAR